MKTAEHPKSSRLLMKNHLGWKNARVGCCHGLNPSIKFYIRERFININFPVYVRMLTDEKSNTSKKVLRYALSSFHMSGNFISKAKGLLVEQLNRIRKQFTVNHIF